MLVSIPLLPAFPLHFNQVLVISYLLSAISFPILLKWLQVYLYSTTFYVHNKTQEPSSMLAEPQFKMNHQTKDQAFICSSTSLAQMPWHSYQGTSNSMLWGNPLMKEPPNIWEFYHHRLQIHKHQCQMTCKLQYENEEKSSMIESLPVVLSRA